MFPAFTSSGIILSCLDLWTPIYIFGQIMVIDSLGKTSESPKGFQVSEFFTHLPQIFKQQALINNIYNDVDRLLTCNSCHPHSCSAICSDGQTQTHTYCTLSSVYFAVLCQYRSVKTIFYIRHWYGDKRIWIYFEAVRKNCASNREILHSHRK